MLTAYISVGLLVGYFGVTLIAEEIAHSNGNWTWKLLLQASLIVLVSAPVLAQRSRLLGRCLGRRPHLTTGTRPPPSSPLRLTTWGVFAFHRTTPHERLRRRRKPVHWP